jgi:hypothetical protein
MDDYKFDIYMLCPVRKATDEQKAFLKEYKRKQEARGLKVHYPADDTNQEDKTGGYRICEDHCGEIASSKSVHAYWTASTGSYVDLGTALREHFRRNMDILLINRKDVEKIVTEQRNKGITKSYEMVLLKLDDLADNATRLE